MIFTDSRITWQIDSSMNKYCWPRWMMASLARTKYVCTMDDDFTLSDDYVLSDMVQHADIEADASQIIGFTGTIFHPNFNESYQNGFHVNANKFNWNNSIELKWQKGIVYQTVSNIQEKYRANSILNSNHALLKNKPWHSTPKWIWEKEEKKEQEKERKKDVPLPMAAGVGVGKKRKIKELNDNNDMNAQKTETVEAVAVAVDIVKGRMMFLHSNALRKVTFAFDVNDIRGDDICISGLVANGHFGNHRVLRTLAHRILELPAPHALCAANSANHYARREAVRRRFFTTEGNKIDTKGIDNDNNTEGNNNTSNNTDNNKSRKKPKQ